MKKVFLDANVAIDLMCERDPWFEDAVRLYSLADMGKIEIYCSSLTLATSSYVMETRKMSKDDIKEKIAHFCEVCTPTLVDASVVQKAIRSSFSDFEDALQYFSAKTVNADIIITRNLKDFAASEIPVMTAEDYLETLFA